MIGVCLEIRQHFIHSPERTPEAVPTFSMKPYYTLADLLDEEHPFDAGGNRSRQTGRNRFSHCPFQIPRHAAGRAGRGGHSRPLYPYTGFSGRIRGGGAAPQKKGDSREPTLRFPHKQAACSLCSDTDALSRSTGSVNTLVFQQDGSVSGFNTDGRGSPAPSGRNFPWICAI